MMAEQETIRIVLADDHAVTRAGIREMLEAVPDLKVVGEAADGDQAQALVADLRPNVLLLDVDMRGCSAFEIAAWVRLNCPETVALILSGHQGGKYLAQAVKQGLQGYLSKDQGFRYLIHAIRRAVCGECVFTDEQRARAERWEREVGLPWGSLTERERQVLVLFARCHDSRAIAEMLGVSVKGVEYHAANLFRKLGVETRVQAVVWYCTHRPDELLPGGNPSGV
jgi:DNA-binding NarL/FixJ family response regulator